MYHVSAQGIDECMTNTYIHMYITILIILFPISNIDTTLLTTPIHNPDCIQLIN